MTQYMTDPFFPLSSLDTFDLCFPMDLPKKANHGTKSSQILIASSCLASLIGSLPSSWLFSPATLHSQQ